MPRTRTKRIRGKLNRYREWLIEHPELLELIASQLDSRDSSRDDEETTKRIVIVKELVEQKELPK